MTSLFSHTSRLGAVAIASATAIVTGVIVWRIVQHETQKQKTRNETKQRLKQIQRHLALQKSALKYLKPFNQKEDTECGDRSPEQPEGEEGDASLSLIRYGRDSLQWALTDLQARIKVLNEMAALSDDEKLETLFELLDVDGNGNIDMYEIGELIRKYSSFNGVYVDLSESFRISKRKIQTFDTDGDNMLNIREFKALVHSWATIGHNTLFEMCDMLAVCLFCEDPEVIAGEDHENNPKRQRDEFEIALQEFAQEHMEELAIMYDSFKKDNDGLIQVGHVRLLIAVAKAKFDGEESRLTLDDMDQGTMDYEQFVRMIYRSISSNTFQELTSQAFFSCLQEILVCIASSEGGFETFDGSSIQGYRARLRGILVPLPDRSSDISSSTVEANSVDPARLQESIRSDSTASIRRSSRILHAATMTQSTLEQKTISGISDYIKIEKRLMETGIIALSQKLTIIDEFITADNKGKVEAIFCLLDRNGDQKINALELADGCRKYGGAGDFNTNLKAAVDSITNFDRDGDAMLDLDEFETYIHNLTNGESEGPVFEVTCAALLIMLLMSEVDSEKDLEEYSVEHVTEAVKVKEAMVQGTRFTNLKTLFGLLDIDAIESVTPRECSMAFEKILGMVVCDNQELLSQRVVTELPQYGGRLELDNLTDYLFNLIMECAPADPLEMFDSFVEVLIRRLLDDMIPEGLKCAAAA